jgi:uncharacterized glyoxalase superfamily protein PhnB
MALPRQGHRGRFTRQGDDLLSEDDPALRPVVHWIFAEDIDASYRELQESGANIVEPLQRMPWGLRQFTVEDLDGNRFYFHHD